MATERDGACAAQVDGRGRLVLPAAIRRRLDLHQGDHVLLSVDEPGVLRLTTAREVAPRLKGSLCDLAAGRDLVAELLAERRREADG